MRGKNQKKWQDPKLSMAHNVRNTGSNYFEDEYSWLYLNSVYF